MRSRHHQRRSLREHEILSHVGSLQNGLQLLLLLACQARRKLDFNTDDEVATFIWLFALWHTQVGVTFCPGRSCRPSTSYAELFAINCLNSTTPASERFFEVEFDNALDVVTFSSEEGMRFLCRC